MAHQLETLLSSTTGPLATQYDVALLDLDGVVYVGAQAVPGVPAALSRAREAGMRLAFVTNNAARTAAAVADHLTSLGVAARAEEVTTSSQAAAHYLADRLPAGAAVLVVGTTGLIEALRERGLTPVDSADDQPLAVVQGYSPDLNWRQLAEGAVAIRRGVLWIATNLDPTVPSPRGPLPGNGSLVAALRHATGVTPLATGKPDPTMHRESVERSGARSPIVVGDRLDTDIEGARRVGCASLLVLSGVTTPAELLSAPAGSRPDFVGRDASALLNAHPATSVDADGARIQARCGRWQAVFDGGPDARRSIAVNAIERSGAEPVGGVEIDDLDPLRALCELAWAADSPGPWDVQAGDDAARSALSAIDASGELSRPDDPGR